jgi:fructose-specific phosphotransferase system component IIB
MTNKHHLGDQAQIGLLGKVIINSHSVRNNHKHNKAQHTTSPSWVSNLRKCTSRTSIHTQMCQTYAHTHARHSDAGCKVSSTQGKVGVKRGKTWSKLQSTQAWLPMLDVTCTTRGNWQQTGLETIHAGDQVPRKRQTIMQTMTWAKDEYEHARLSTQLKHWRDPTKQGTTVQDTVPIFNQVLRLTSFIKTPPSIFTCFCVEWNHLTSKSFFLWAQRPLEILSRQKHTRGERSKGSHVFVGPSALKILNR